MNLDWVTTIVPIINATGIPLLAIGILLLLRAYQKSVETYKDTTIHLKDENGRLRKQLSSLDSNYTDSLNKMRETVSKSMQAIGELQAAKISLLTNLDNSTAAVVESDVERIDEVLEMLLELVDIAKQGERTKKEIQKEMEEKITDEITGLEMRINSQFNELGKVINEIGDTKSRLSIARVITTDEIFQTLDTEVRQQKRGLNFFSERKSLELDSPEMPSLPPAE